MKKKADAPGIFDMIMAGLEESVAYSRGEKKTLVTARVPDPPPAMGPEEVIRLRKRLNMSQGLFAATLNVSEKTVQGWEQGLRTPGNASLRLLQIAGEHPRAVWAVAGGGPAGKSRTPPPAERCGAKKAPRS
jgi:putative transcriptional regulator